MSSRNSKAFKFPGLETSHASLVAGDEDDVTVDVLLFAPFIFFFVVIFRVGTTGKRPTAAQKDMCSQKRKEMKT
jgi:hypothetical protein